MKVAVSRTSERFAADLEQLRKESTDQIRRSFDSLVTLKDFLSEAGTTSGSDRYAKLVSKLDSMEKKLSHFEDSLNDRVARLIREYDKLKTELDGITKEKKLYKTLYELSRLISVEHDVKEIMPEIVQAVSDILTCDHAVLQLLMRTVRFNHSMRRTAKPYPASIRPRNKSPKRSSPQAIQS